MVNISNNNLRVSSFIIPVKVDENRYMLLHGYSGAIELVDENIYKILSGKVDFNCHLIDNETLEHLVKRGFITSYSYSEELERQNKFATLLHRRDTLLSSSYTIVVTYKCNFRCPYCFEKQSVHSLNQEQTMSREMVDKVFINIDRLQSKKARKTNFVTLFGGEPLLRENKDIVSYIVRKGMEYGLKFKAITNGYDLDYFSDLLSLDKICALQITIDGMACVHNKKRLHYLGLPTFDTIIKNVGIALDKGIYVTIRVNTDKNNFNQLAELKSLFDSLGCIRNTKFRLDSARLMNFDDDLDEKQKGTFMTQQEFINAHDNKNQEFECHDYETYSNIYHSILNNEPLAYRSTFCGSQVGGCVFDPLYKIYPCWDLVGNQEYQIGDYSGSTIVWDEKRRRMWSSTNVTSYVSCKGCKCALFCGGGCMAHNFNQHHCTHMMDIIKYATKRAYAKFNL